MVVHRLYRHVVAILLDEDLEFNPSVFTVGGCLSEIS